MLERDEASQRLALPAGMSRHGYASRQPGGMRQRHFDGTNFKPKKLPKNAPAKRPTSGP
jgi:hypothetical protein